MAEIKELLEKEMSRQEFLKFSALALVSLFGVGNLIKYVLAYKDKKEPVQVKQQGTTGFGSSKFGV